MGTGADYHQRFAGNCLELPDGRCFDSGTGPGVFDCSGLVIRAECDVMGRGVTEWAPNLRHVRDMWRSALDDEGVFRICDLATGVLLVARRHYTINGSRMMIPGHIGIISAIGDTPSVIHASPAAGRVEERPLKTLQTIMGYVAATLE